LGPGYYKNQDDLKNMKKEFEMVVHSTRKNTGAFGSSTTREVGSNIQTTVNASSYMGVAGKYYDNIRDSSVTKPSFN
jgi:uncharacterized protein YvpB